MKLFVDDMRECPKGWTLARNYDEAIELLKSGKITHISLDHDLGENSKTGYELAKDIEFGAYCGELPSLEWEIHSSNPVGRENMVRALEKADYYWSLRNA